MNLVNDSFKLFIERIKKLYLGQIIPLDLPDVEPAAQVRSEQIQAGTVAVILPAAFRHFAGKVQINLLRAIF